MQLKRYTLLLLGFLAGAMAMAQPKEQNGCGYSGISPWLDWYQRNTGLFATDGGSDSTWLYVPVTLHIVGTNNGSGYFPFDQAIQAVCGMNEQYAPAHIRFYLMPGDAVRYHNNSSWYNHDFDAGAEMILTCTAGIEDRLNAFIVSDPAGNCGYAWYDAIVLKKGCSNDGNATWAHEAGHHFSLPHPFSGWEDYSWDYSKAAPFKVNNRDVEKVDGSNCYTGGDRFCDTEADYLSLSRWSCNGDARSYTVQHDPNNISFRSDGTLIMGYALDACQARFTEEQYAAVRANLLSEHSHYLQLNDPLPEIDDKDQVELISPVDTTETVQFNHIELKWRSVPQAQYYAVEISKSPSFSSKFFYDTVTDTSVTVTKGIPNNWNLYWRVRAYSDWDICQPYDQAQLGIFRTQNLSATNDLERSAIIDLAPNPVIAGAAASLRIEADQAMDLSVVLSDAAGRLCYKKLLRLYSGENQLEIPTANLNAGLYSILLQNEKGATVKRLAIIE